MKVLIYGHYFFSVDLLWGFVQLGWEAEVIMEYSKERIIEIIKRGEADLLLTCGGPLEFDKDVLAWIGINRPSGMKYVHWDTDGISSMLYPSRSGEGIEMDVIYAAKPDLVLTMCPEMLEFLREKGFFCGMMYYAYSPLVHHPMPEFHDEEHKYINLIGTSYSEIYPSKPDHYRYHSLKVLLAPLIDHGYTVHIYGDPGYVPFARDVLGINLSPDNYHGKMPYDRTCAAYNSSFINIATQNHEKTLTKRTFEILGSGGFALTMDTSKIRELFIPDQDLVVSSSPEQTLELVKYYETHIEEWRQIRKNALRSVEEHTYKHRVKDMLAQLDQLTIQ